MPDDVLQFVIGPSPYAATWLWVGLALLAVVVIWYVGVFTWTLPAERLRSIPWIRSVHSKLLRRRISRAIHAIDERYRAGELTTAQAGRQMSKTLRSFLQSTYEAAADSAHWDRSALECPLGVPGVPTR